MNGQHLADRSIAIDPFSIPNEMFVHYLINKNDIIDFGKKIKSHDDGLMKFTLSPVSATDQIVKSSNTGNNSGD